MKKALFIAPFALSLAACGIIPTPQVAIPDAQIPLSASLNTSDQVIYLNQNSLGGASLPSILQGLTIRGDALYVNKGGTLKSVKLYVRSALPASGCTPVANTAFVCPAAGESAQAIGTVTLSANVSMPFTLQGAALDDAAKKGTGYFGVQVLEGRPLDTESVRLINMKAQARL